LWQGFVNRKRIDETVKVKQSKIDQVIELHERGLRPCDIVKILNVSRTTVWNILSGKAEGYEVDYFREFEQIPDHKRKDLVQEQPETPEEVCIRTELAYTLKAMLDELPIKDQDIVNARADGLSDRAIIVECKTSRGYIKRVFEGLRSTCSFPSMYREGINRDEPVTVATRPPGHGPKG
jgi:DNA-directed RNA polymerase specialized sigma subunit